MYLVWLLVGLILFLGIHSVRMVAPAWREARIEAMGEGGWKGLYSIASLAGLVILIYGYGVARVEAPILYVTPLWMAWITTILMAIAFILFVAGNIPSGRIKPAVKHPQLTAVKTWAFAHLLVNGDLASVLLFGLFLAWAVWNRIAVKRRGGRPPEPGPVTYDLIAVVIGLALWVLFLWQAHAWLFGVPAIIA